MKTIKDKGKAYQAGAAYEFSADGMTWYLDILEGIYPESNYPYETRSDDYKHIRICEVNQGTIEEAPVNLIDGECYQYTNQLGNERKGLFSAKHDTFCSNRGWSDRSECTNIKLLVVGEQNEQT